MRSFLDALPLPPARPASTGTAFWQAWLDDLLLHAGLASARLRLHDSTWAAARGRPDATSAAPASRIFPVMYAAEPIGELVLSWPPAAAGDERNRLGEALARQCAYLFKRQVVEAWTAKRLGRPLLLVGRSDALHRLDVFVEKAAHSSLPVLVMGEFGTEKALLAAAVHCCGPQRDGPFVEVNCADPAGQPAQWFDEARGGTLFFNGIDELPRQLQAQVPQCMPSRLGQWLVAAGAAEVRVVASAATDLGQRVRDGLFSRQLQAELAFLTVTVPPLRERPGDIPELLAAVLARQGFDPQRVCTGDLVRLCRQHGWPENLFELERVLARLAVMNDGQPLHEADVARHAPWLLATAPEARAAAAAAPADVAEPPEPRSLRRHLQAPAGHWVRCAVARDTVGMAPLHAGLRKALLYLGEHYAEPISLELLAGQAHVSASHLGFLFRSSLSTTFKPLLQQIRIEKAKELLGHERGPRITEVALSVGFGDLSHFEKSFRRHVGRSPREFRRGIASCCR
ncbi:helix-turn-helix domain-containing protein [Roseateles cellulosilyticus]|uniref:Helix-turn-helix domain-containing protein n=1 Tax=Pelomonas cellulosilytica TaxID=2906762 RepID=A0ABS8XTQ2_9BURK|nr:helix-turn-helix domain-containing protein [Pelomonas sp. P8]MCE4554583.1 helix-turn-helix domain-containing protein [Pelomonas sp. P8]